MYRPSINIDFHGTSSIPGSENYTNYTLSADGTITPLTDRVISVTYAEGEALNASVSFDGYDVFFYYYGDDITVEDALKILSNLK